MTTTQLHFLTILLTYVPHQWKRYKGKNMSTSYGYLEGQVPRFCLVNMHFVQLQKRIYCTIFYSPI